jgi:hypothetical protein
MIDYKLLSDAIDYYTKIGYKYIEVPWAVNPEVLAITAPPSVVPYYVDTGVLVASGEQGFLQLIINRELMPGRYCTLTPCFRKEKEYSELTKHYFMKVELIDIPLRIDKYSESRFWTMLWDAKMFFDYNLKVVDRSTHYELVSETQFDIMLGEIELGSYGYREFEDISWYYGTGLAEPRFSATLRSV